MESHLKLCTKPRRRLPLSHRQMKKCRRHWEESHEKTPTNRQVSDKQNRFISEKAEFAETITALQHKLAKEMETVSASPRVRPIMAVSH